MGLKIDIRTQDTKYTIENENIKIFVDFGDVEKATKAAQVYLTPQAAADMANSVPFRQGPLRENIWYPEGLVGGIIEYNSPYAHYMYEGVKYVNPKTGKSGYQNDLGIWGGWSGEKIPTSEKLHYYTEGTGDHWDQIAAEKYGDQWLQGVANAFIRSL